MGNKRKNSSNKGKNPKKARLAPTTEPTVEHKLPENWTIVSLVDSTSKELAKPWKNPLRNNKEQNSLTYYRLIVQDPAKDKTDEISYWSTELNADQLRIVKPWAKEKKSKQTADRAEERIESATQEDQVLDSTVDELLVARSTALNNGASTSSSVLLNNPSSSTNPTVTPSFLSLLTGVDGPRPSRSSPSVHVESEEEEIESDYFDSNDHIFDRSYFESVSIPPPEPRNLFPHRAPAPVAPSALELSINAITSALQQQQEQVSVLQEQLNRLNEEKLLYKRAFQMIINPEVGREKGALELLTVRPRTHGNFGAPLSDADYNIVYCSLYTYKAKNKVTKQIVSAIIQLYVNINVN